MDTEALPRFRAALDQGYELVLGTFDPALTPSLELFADGLIRLLFRLHGLFRPNRSGRLPRLRAGCTASSGGRDDNPTVGLAPNTFLPAVPPLVLRRPLHWLGRPVGTTPVLL
jgi:hypothetical protein